MKLKELEKRLRDEPQNLGLRVALAGAYREVGRLTDAVDLYRSVAIAYRDQGRVQQAIAVCKSVLELAPNDAPSKALLLQLTPPPPAPPGPPSGVRPIAENVDIEVGTLVAAPVIPERPAQALIVRPPIMPERDSSSQSGPRRRSSFEGETPLPTAVPYHVHDPTTANLKKLSSQDLITQEEIALPVPEPTDVGDTGRHSLPVVPGQTKLPPQPQPLGRPSPPTRFSPPTGRISPPRDRISPQTDRLSPPADRLSPPTDRLSPPTGKVTVPGRAPVPTPPDPEPTLPSPPPRASRPSVAGIASAARRISSALVGASDDRDIIDPTTELDTRERPRLESDEVERLSKPPPTVPFERTDLDEPDDDTNDVDDDAKTPVPGLEHREEDQTQPRAMPGTRARAPTVSMLTTQFFAPLPAEHRKSVLQRFMRRTVDDGTHVINQGEIAHPLVLVTRGRLDCRAERADGKLIQVGTIAMGEYVGEVALLHRVPAAYHVIAAGSAEVLLLPPRDFYELAGAFPALWAELKDVAERRQREYEYRMRAGR